MKEGLHAVTLTGKAKKALLRFPQSIQQRVGHAIDELAECPRPRGCVKMAKDTYRIRVGRDYRVIYTIDDKERVVTVFKVSTREGAY